MSGPANIRPVALRLAALLPRLASGHDGEVVATVRAIGRVLETVGADWHDLTAALTSPTVNVPFRAQPHPQPARRHAAARQPKRASPEASHNVLLAEWAGYCALHGMHRLPLTDLSFAVSMANKLRLGHKLGVKQEERLKALYERLRAAA